MEIHGEGDLRLFKFGPLGPYENNAYVIADHTSQEALVVDMPTGSSEVIEVAKTFRVKGIALTHTHPDHWTEYDAVKAALGAPVMCHPAEVIMPANRIEVSLSDGEEISLGGLTVKVIHAPGHTPGSTCFLAGRFLIAGDVLFPGGPGHTDSPDAFKQSLQSIEEKLLMPLADDVMVLPGHGADTTIGQSKREYAGFTLRQHADDLCGDVTWAD
jgi:glyoxylase-like metal-dependent hydrolase (beta-lactamase superfamily II)